MTTLQKEEFRAALSGAWLLTAINTGISTQSYQPWWPGFTYNGSTAPRPHPGWLCCTHTVCNENEDAHHYLGSSLSLGMKASSRSAQAQSPAPCHEEPAGSSTQLPCLEPAPLRAPESPCCGGFAAVLLPCPSPKPPQSVRQLSRSSAHLLQTITPITTDTSTVSPVMATTVMMRTGFCSLEATVTVRGKQSRSATRPRAGPRHGAASATPPSASLHPPTRLRRTPAAPGYFSPSSQEFTFWFSFKSSSWCNQNNVQGSAAGTDGATPALPHQAPGFVNQR